MKNSHTSLVRSVQAGAVALGAFRDEILEPHTRRFPLLLKPGPPLGATFGDQLGRVPGLDPW